MFPVRKRIRARLLQSAVALMVSLCPTLVLAENSVVVESHVVPPGATNLKVGVLIENDVALSSIVIPLEIRTVNGGAYVDGPFTLETIALADGGRIGTEHENRVSPRDPQEAPLHDGSLTRFYNTPETGDLCGGPLSSSFGSGESIPNADGVSPDAVLWVGLVQFRRWDPNYYFEPGSDAANGIASIVLTMDVNDHAGEFEIDTACVLPRNHLIMVDRQVNLIPVAFTKGVIKVCEPGPDCCFNCACHSDPLCDGVTDLADVAIAVGVSFLEASASSNEGCTLDQTDVDCDGSTGVLDVVRFVNVAFRNADPATQFCVTCPP